MPENERDKMLFVKTQDLKVGMRLARPIYNRKGVLLFEQDSKLTSQSITSIINFKLIGVYILEPAEPAPPMTEQDMAFERFQAEYVYQLMDEMEGIVKNGKDQKLNYYVNVITKNYGHNEGKIQFIQSLRSNEDYVFKHSLNVAILATMMAYQMKLRIEDCEEIIISAVLHDIGKIIPDNNNKAAGDSEEDNAEVLLLQEMQGHDLLEQIYSGKPNIKRICRQAFQARREYLEGKNNSVRMVNGSKILMIADYFDTMTAMSYKKTPQSEVITIKQMMDNPQFFDPRALQALIDSINLVIPGMSVELNTGDKALVLLENKENILRPLVLLFRDNSMMDLAARENRDIEIVDIMKTLDNRYIMVHNSN